MAHITAIGAGVYSALAINTTPITNLSAVDTLAELVSLFAAPASFSEIKNVREFPPMGTPANIVNVPVYGQKTTSQIQGQADAPSMEMTINYVPADWASTAPLGMLVGDGRVYAFQFSLLNSRPAGLSSAVGPTGLGSVPNSNFYFAGKVEAILVTPQLTDANQATLTLTVIGDFFGPATVNAT